MEAAAIGQAEARTIVRVHRTAMAVIARFVHLKPLQHVIINILSIKLIFSIN